MSTKIASKTQYERYRLDIPLMGHFGGSAEGQVVQRAEAFLQTDGTHERSVGRRAHEGEAEKR